jgi:hypothetical protein
MTDKFGEYVTAALTAIALIGALTMQAVLLMQGRTEAAMPLWVIGIANAAIFYYVGQKKGQTSLNGNVTKLANATQQLADAASSAKKPSNLSV